MLGPRLWVARHLRVGIPLFTGRWGLPVPFAIPLPTAVTFVVGRRIDVGPPNPFPTEEQAERPRPRGIFHLGVWSMWCAQTSGVSLVSCLLQVETLFELYSSEVCRMFTEHAARLLPKEVAVNGIRVRRIGSQGNAREAVPNLPHVKAD